MFRGVVGFAGLSRHGLGSWITLSVGVWWGSRGSRLTGCAVALASGQVCFRVCEAVTAQVELALSAGV